jgi:hypothetical protein
MKSILRLLFATWILPVFGKSLLTPTITYVDSTGPVTRVGFNIAASGSYVSGGDTVNLSTAGADPNFIGMVPAIESLSAPIDFDVWDMGGQITYVVAPVVGATAATCKVKFATALTTELSAASYPAGLTGAKLVGEAVFNKI